MAQTPDEVTARQLVGEAARAGAGREPLTPGSLEISLWGALEAIMATRYSGGTDPLALAARTLAALVATLDRSGLSRDTDYEARGVNTTERILHAVAELEESLARDPVDLESVREQVTAVNKSLRVLYAGLSRRTVCTAGGWIPAHKTMELPRT